MDGYGSAREDRGYAPQVRVLDHTKPIAKRMGPGPALLIGFAFPHRWPADRSSATDALLPMPCYPIASIRSTDRRARTRISSSTVIS